ncbi:hypothetical protein KFK09_004167 [Dendrobium nobile]|uniref:RNase H type-1 domain-containing protein n=1 Tax=Dendrobium nobile TaxID=94219 RepID=A0A8T3C572_DENNO|nr:hypothetical protein KFK09_004167 [Dendrobium nobile]
MNASRIIRSVCDKIQLLYESDMLKYINFKGCWHVLHAFNIFSNPGAQENRVCIIRWLKHEVDWIKINTDGSYNGKVAGCGGILRNHLGQVIKAFVGPVSGKSACVAELHGIIYDGIVLACLILRSIRGLSDVFLWALVRWVFRLGCDGVSGCCGGCFVSVVFVSGVASGWLVGCSPWWYLGLDFLTGLGGGFCCLVVHLVYLVGDNCFWATADREEVKGEMLMSQMFGRVSCKEDGAERLFDDLPFLGGVSLQP